MEKTLKKEVRILDFVEKYYTKYSSSQRIAELNDLYKAEEDRDLNLSEIKEQNHLEALVYQDSIKAFLKAPIEEHKELGEKYFYEVIKPKLVEMAEKGELDSDFNQVFI